jgi:hypothetical protein
VAYDVHIVRTKDWLQASASPITKPEVDALVAGDMELEWSTSDYVDMSDDLGSITRYYMIAWKEIPCFWWYRDQILCSGPDDNQIIKLVRLAHALNAHVVGDDGEMYELRKNFLGKEKLIIVPTGG